MNKSVPVDIVWDLMAGAYGGMWTSSHGDHDKSGIWAQGIKKFTPEQIKQALAKAIKFYKESPPTLGQFLALCEDAPGYSGSRRLEHQREFSSKENSRQWIADLHEMIAQARAKGSLSEKERKFHMDMLGIKEESWHDKTNRPGFKRQCAHAGCNLVGTFNHSKSGGGSWVCFDHWMRS